MTQYKFNVEMTCSGCSKAVNSVLTKTPGVEKVTIDLENKLVTVEGTADQATLLAAIQKTGKKCSPVS